MIGKAHPVIEPGRGSRIPRPRRPGTALTVILGATLLLPALTILFPSARAASGTVVVGPGNQVATGWLTLQGIFGKSGPDTGTQSYESGPATPPLGSGSLEFRIGTNNNWSEAVGYTGLNNVPLGSLTALSYSTFLEQFSNKAQDFFAILVIDTNGDHIADDFLFFFPANQQGCSDGAPNQHDIMHNQWQNWDARAGVWVSAFGLCNAENSCGTGNDPKTLAEYLACLPTARIINDDAGTASPSDDTPGLIVGYGGDTVSANFIGNLDNVKVGVSGMTTTFDFDPTVQTLVVGPGNQTAQGWQTLQGIFGEPGPDTGTQVYENGPATPPLGVGSLEFRIGSNNNWSEAVGYTGVHNVGLANLTELSFSTFVEQASNGSQDFFAILVIDTNGDLTADDFLFFFPANQQGCSDEAPPQHAISQGVWQIPWDARRGVWVSAFGLCGAQNFCGAADDPKTLEDYLVCFPNARIINDNAGDPGLIIGYGGDTVSANFIGNLDNVRVGVSGMITIFDFDPCVLTCPTNQTRPNDPNQCGAVVNYPAATDNGGACGPIICSPASGSFFPKGTTTVTCKSNGGAGPEMCMFTVTVNDTQPPTITCPANVTTVTPVPGGSSAVVTFPPPTASDNCPGFTTACNPPSGSTFPVGCSTVTCTATDASGNTATCNFQVCVFNICLQDDSNAQNRILINTATGDYRFCCNGTTFTGKGKITQQGSTFTLEHNPLDRRVRASVTIPSKVGNASLQAPPGKLRCNIADSNITDNTTCSTCQ